MACTHKFSEDLNLDYVSWEVNTLFIGTFNPGCISCENNYAKWFYGRTQRNEFWAILPKVYGEPSKLDGNREKWIAFCKLHGLAITDIIQSLKNANEDSLKHREIICKFKDDDFAEFDILVTDIPAILEKHTSIKQICFTRQTMGKIWDSCFFDLFKWIKANPERNVQVKYLRSPSRGAIKGVVGNFSDFIADRWIKQGYKK